MADYDAVLVGSGINSLACGALLARAGWSVCVLERESELGGAIRTAELTEPGFLHDVFSAWHPLWVGGAAHARGPRGRRRQGRSEPGGIRHGDADAAVGVACPPVGGPRRRR